MGGLRNNMQQEILSNIFVEVQIKDYKSLFDELKIGDLILNRKRDKVELVISSLDENFLIQNEVSASLGNFGCHLYRQDAY